MEKAIAAVLGIIRDEIAIYRDLIEHARKKTALLAGGSVLELLESNKVEETFNIKLRILETEMMRLCAELAKAFNIPRTEFTLLKLAEGIEHSIALELRSQTSLFRNLIEQLRAVNQRNMKLVESSMRYSRGILDMMANATSSYQGTGLFLPLPATQTTFSRRA